ncbi:hypothetical protein EVAR_46723_1 [Eumeta japonica]|uniref:Uncharacterized protein n=1 Tax=Eumeta variegata TaxID=151549 RepID=A0A4C1XE98_EUMVA|nr:hypothetical protein EVAR_46723_1 [Eumeta japonica]
MGSARRRALGTRVSSRGPPAILKTNTRTLGHAHSRKTRYLSSCYSTGRARPNSPRKTISYNYYERRPSCDFIPRVDRLMADCVPPNVAVFILHTCCYVMGLNNERRAQRRRWRLKASPPTFLCFTTGRLSPARCGARPARARARAGARDGRAPTACGAAAACRAPAHPPHG